MEIRWKWENIDRQTENALDKILRNEINISSLIKRTAKFPRVQRVILDRVSRKTRENFQHRVQGDEFWWNFLIIVPSFHAHLYSSCNKSSVNFEEMT